MNSKTRAGLGFQVTEAMLPDPLGVEKQSSTQECQI